MDVISDVAIKQFMSGLNTILNREGVTEVMINRPQEAFIETYGDIKQERIEWYTYDKLLHFAKLVASYTHQQIDEKSPLLSATMPTGERVQIVIPPACPIGEVVFSIRKPSSLDLTLNDYEKTGAFSTCTFEVQKENPQDKHLLELKSKNQIQSFLQHAIKYKKNIILSGGTSSGKTTFLNAMLREIPLDERIITIEDARETKLPHQNRVHLLYSKGGQGISKVTATELLEVCLRLRPDRILPAEIRGEEAFTFLESINSGHPGSMTSMHANSASSAIKRLEFMCLRAKTGLTRQEISDYIHNVVDIIVQLERVNGVRRITDIYYEPEI